ncbi:hypothetical protein PCANC_19690 [Puccinia coronata f. sp. avenae]|uniref:Uncharacterized protein n=1 Tax=Puccinia coronata f. sp. avenae TaxID=200324 RepID=A0A2N5SAZ1_9BASI|nr:hypothetical protein PCANC_19690 [Puccinia coronata f. sp. avenae]
MKIAKKLIPKIPNSVNQDPKNACFDAFICALDLLDRRRTSSFTHPRDRTQSKISPPPTHHKHVLIITASDNGPPAMSINPNTVDELPRTLPFLNYLPQYNAVSF